MLPVYKTRRDLSLAFYLTTCPVLCKCELGVKIFIHFWSTNNELEPDSHISFRCLSTVELVWKLVLYALFVCYFVFSRWCCKRSRVEKPWGNNSRPLNGNNGCERDNVLPRLVLTYLALPCLAWPCLALPLSLIRALRVGSGEQI